MKYLISIFLLTLTLQQTIAQTLKNDTTLVYRFSDAFSLMVSEDESKLAVIIDNNKLEIYEVDSIRFIKRIKVSRNTWLDKAFFHDKNSLIYYDYGTQLNYKYKKVDLMTGKKKNVKCQNVPKGCGYRSIKYCSDENPTLELKNKRLMFKIEDIDIEVYEIK
jgi:hypothetical protein